MKIGSDAHKTLFCRQFCESYTEFDPETLPWPALDDAALARLRAVPFWQEVLHTERRAGAIVKAFAVTIDDPEVREAVDLQGREETRHAELLRVMIERYGLDATAQPLEALDPDAERALRISVMASASTRSSVSACSRSRARAASCPRACSRSSTR